VTKKLKRISEKERVRRYINEYKSKSGCNRCPETDPVCLTFHHIDEKEFSISNFSRRTLEEVKTEIKKCEVLCCNCHRKEHIDK